MQTWPGLGQHRDHVLDGAGADASVARRTNRQCNVVGSRAVKNVLRRRVAREVCPKFHKKLWFGPIRSTQTRLLPARLSYRSVEELGEHLSNPCLASVSVRRVPRGDDNSSNSGVVDCSSAVEDFPEVGSSVQLGTIFL